LIVNYRTEDVAARIKAEVGGVDHIVDVDLGQNLPLSAQVLKANGVIACYASTSIPRPEYPYPELSWRNPVVRQVFVYTMPDAAKAQAHADIARWIAESKPIFAIAHRFP
jgi:NADPH2:quinone reductase